MSSSNVVSQFSVEKEAVPIGSAEFVERYYQAKDENSPLGKQIKLLEQKHQVELQQSYQNGYAQGEAVGMQRGMVEAQQVKAELSTVITQIHNYQRTLYDLAKARLFELAFTIADKITTARAESEQQVVMETIERCIAELLDATKIKVKVNPSQLGFVRENIEAMAVARDMKSSIVVEADTRVSVGGCIVDTDSGSADARIESQLQLLKEKLIALEQSQ